MDTKKVVQNQHRVYEQFSNHANSKTENLPEGNLKSPLLLPECPAAHLQPKPNRTIEYQSKPFIEAPETETH